MIPAERSEESTRSHTEWKKCRTSTKALVLSSMLLPLAAVGLISRGNYIPEQASAPATTSTP